MTENTKVGQTINYYDYDGNFISKTVYVPENGKDKYWYDGCDENGINCTHRIVVSEWFEDGSGQSGSMQSCNKAEDSRCKE